LAKFHNNPAKLYTLLIRLKQGDPRQNKARVLESFESLSNLIKAAVISLTRASDTLTGARNKNSPLNSRKNDEKSFWKTIKGKGTNQ